MGICSRIYFLAIAGVMLASAAVALVSLGGFAKEHVEVTTSGIDHRLPNCILFGTKHKIPDEDEDYLRYSEPGACNFALAGQSILILLAVGLLIYNIIQAILGAKLVSFMRFVDFVVLLLGFLLSLSVSITLTAGLDKTCKIYKELYSLSCPDAYTYGKKHIYFYKGLQISIYSAWIFCGVMFLLGLWNGFWLMVRTCSKRNKEDSYTVQEDELGEEGGKQLTNAVEYS